MVHLHDVRDTDTHYIIDPITMAISNANHKKNKLMQGDHNSEVYTFELPKTIEGHEMMLCDKVELHFINNKSDKTAKSSDVYVVKDMHIDEKEQDKIIFTVTLDGKASKYEGSLWIRILFACTKDGVYTYKKWTEIFKDLAVGEGFENKTGVIEENSDLLLEWKHELEEQIANASVSQEQVEQIEKNTQDISELSEQIADKATLDSGVIKFFKSGETDKELFNVDLSELSAGLDLENLTMSVSAIENGNRLTLSDGTTTKSVDIPTVSVTDEQIESLVNAWLEAHPEATTTVQDGSVTPNKTSFFYTQTKYTNLYDSAASTKGFEVKCNSGTEATNVNAYISDYMPVESGKSYYIGRANGTLGQDMVSVSSWAFYDKNKNFVTQSVPSATGGWNPIPDGVAYMRISVYYSTGNNNCMVVEGTETPTKYVSYADGISKSGGWCDKELKEYIQKEQLEYTAENLVLSGQRLEDKTVTPNKFSTAKVYSLNLANPDEVETGYKLNVKNGNLVSYEYSDVSGFIPVNKGKTLYPNSLIASIVFYDKNKNFVSYVPKESFNNKVIAGIEPPVDGYVRIAYNKEKNLGVSEYCFDMTTRRYGDVLTVYDDAFKNELNISGLILEKWNLCDEYKFIEGNVFNGVFIDINVGGNLKGYIVENVPHTELVALRGNNNNLLVLEYDAGWNYLKTSEVVQASDKLFYYTPSSDVVNVIVQAGFLALSNPDRNKYLAEIKYASYEEAIQMQYFPVGMKGYIKNYLCDELLASDSENILRNLYNSAGLKWNCLGDSLTTNSWGHTMYNIVSDKLGIIPTNYGIVSSTIADYNNDGTTGNPMCVRYSTMSDDADIVTVMGCTNDDSSKIGTFEDTDGTTLYGACHVLFKGLVEKYPNAKIGVILPPQNGQCNPTYVSTQGGDPMMKKMSAKVSVVKEVAEFYGLPVCDLFHHGGISGYLDSSIGTTLQGDYLHLTTVGHEVLASKLMSFIKELLSNNG